MTIDPSTVTTQVPTGIPYTFPIQDEATFITLVKKFLETPYIGQPFDKKVCLRDGKIIYMKISAKTTVSEFAPAEKMKPFLEKW